MRIVFVENEDILRNSSGGVMSYILNIAKYLKGRKISTLLIGSGTGEYSNIEYDFDNVFSISEKSEVSNFVFFLKLFYSNVYSNLKIEDIIHVQRPEMVIPIAIRTKNRIVCSLHGGQDIAVYKKKGYLQGVFYSILQRLSFHIVDYLIAVDSKNKDRYIAKYPWIKDKIEVIPISVNVDRFFPRNRKELREKLEMPLEKFILLFIGRLESEKNVEFLINSFNYLENNERNKLLIIGDGSLKSSLVELASTMSVDIVFLGEISNAQIPEYINISNVLCLTSSFEGSPTVVKEALHCNVPVISTDVGDVKEVLGRVNGGLIINRNKSSFSEAVKSIKEISNFDFSVINSLYGINIMGKSTENIYRLFHK